MAGNAGRARTRLQAPRLPDRSAAAAVAAPTHIAFLRAVNVGGTGVVKMTDVVTAFEQAGCEAVRSVGHAGNLLWTQTGRHVPAAQIASALGRLLGRPADIMFRSAREMAAIVAADPFGPLTADKRVKLYVVFLAAAPTQVPRLPVRFDKDALELVAVTGREAYVVSRKIPGKLMYGFPNPFVEKLFGVAATSRNWSTVTKVAARCATGAPSGPASRTAAARPAVPARRR